MKRVFTKITAAFLMSAALAGCGMSPDSAQQAGAVEVLAPQPQEEGGYALKFVKLLGLDSLETVTGKYVRFFMSPRIVDGQLYGKPPVGKFIKNSEGQFVPANDMTQQLVTVYSHVQKLAQLDDELGAGGINTWPRDIGVAVRVRGGMNNNAFYDGKTDSMLFVPYTENDLAIAINGGILAHEHFHSLFFKLVLKDTTLVDSELHERGSYILAEDGAENFAESTKTPAQFRGVKTKDDPTFAAYHLAMLRGINEGLSDFWGWMYTGDPDFIAQSLPAVKDTRSLKAQSSRAVLQLPMESTVKRSVEVLFSMSNLKVFDEQVTSYAYTLASQYSRVLKRFSEISGQSRNLDSLQSRKETAKLIVKMLPLLKRDFLVDEQTYFTSIDFVKALVEVQPLLNEQECAYLAAVLFHTNEDVQRDFQCKAEDGIWSLEEVAADILLTPTVLERRE